jgi:hypothetical protein
MVIRDRTMNIKNLFEGGRNVLRRLCKNRFVQRLSLSRVPELYLGRLPMPESPFSGSQILRRVSPQRRKHLSEVRRDKVSLRTVVFGHPV